MGVNGGCHACTLAGLLSLCLGNGASPRGLKFGISILRGNGPPFAACHRKIGGFVLARVPPAERGPVFPLCSMTPLILTVDSLSLPSSVSSPSSYFIGRKKKNHYDHIWRGSLADSLPSNRRFSCKWTRAEWCHADGEPPVIAALIPRVPVRVVIFQFRAVILGFMMEQMPVCMQANEVAEYGSEFRPTLHRGDLSLFGAVPSAPHRPAQRRQKITKVLTILQRRILIGNWCGRNIIYFILFFLELWRLWEVRWGS